MPSCTEKLLQLFLKKVVVVGNCTVRCASGYEFPIGNGKGKEITVTFNSRRAQRRLVRNPELAVGELFVDEEYEIAGGDVFDLLEIVLKSLAAAYASTKSVKPWFRPCAMPGTLARQKNTLEKARKNAAHHYNLDRRLYDLFLDVDLQYSCAYFETSGMTLDAAQAAKRRHIASKMLLEPSASVLDIGSGFGGLALYLAQVSDVKVRGVTLSYEQLCVSRARAEERGLAEKVAFELEDFRNVAGKFDRIVSVGMLEHVGVHFLEQFFRKVGALLKDDGVALIHTIAGTVGPKKTNPWILKYIFPGGYIPSLSEFSIAIERAGLITTDMEVLRLHYAETLEHWRKRFNEKREEVAKMFDERFCRIWDFYLAVSEASFRAGQNVVCQIQLAKKVDAVPLTREYMMNKESELRELEEKSP